MSLLKPTTEGTAHQVQQPIVSKTAHKPTQIDTCWTTQILPTSDTQELSQDHILLIPQTSPTPTLESHSVETDSDTDCESEFETGIQTYKNDESTGSSNNIEVVEEHVMDVCFPRELDNVFASFCQNMDRDLSPTVYKVHYNLGLYVDYNQRRAIVDELGRSIKSIQNKLHHNLMKESEIKAYFCIMSRIVELSHEIRAEISNDPIWSELFYSAPFSIDSHEVEQSTYFETYNTPTQVDPKWSLQILPYGDVPDYELPENVMLPTPPKSSVLSMAGHCLEMESDLHACEYDEDEFNRKETDSMDGSEQDPDPSQQLMNVSVSLCKDIGLELTPMVHKLFDNHAPYLACNERRAVVKEVSNSIKRVHDLLQRNLLQEREITDYLQIISRIAELSHDIQGELSNNPIWSGPGCSSSVSNTEQKKKLAMALNFDPLSKTRNGIHQKKSTFQHAGKETIGYKSTIQDVLNPAEIGDVNKFNLVAFASILGTNGQSDNDVPTPASQECMALKTSMRGVCEKETKISIKVQQSDSIEQLQAGKENRFSNQFSRLPNSQLGNTRATFHRVEVNPLFQQDSDAVKRKPMRC